MLLTDKVKKIEIGILTSVHHPLDGRIFYKQATSLQKAGYAIELLCYFQDDILEKQTIEGIEIIPLKKRGSLRLYRFLGLYNFVKMAVKKRYSIIHIHDPELIPVALLIKLISRTKIIYDIHEDYESAIIGKKWIPGTLRKPVSAGYRLLENVTLKIFDALIPTTEQIAAKYKHPNITVIFNYPPKSNYVPSQFKKKLQQIIYVGGITEARGIYETLEALEVLKKFTDVFRVIFLGGFASEALEKKVKSIVSKKKLQEHVEFKPKVLYHQIFQQLVQSSVGLLPYLCRPNHYTTLPNKLFEYMATGNAIVSNSLPQYEVVVNKYNCGLAVDVTDKHAYAQAIYKLISDSKQAEIFQTNAYKAYSEYCNWDSEEKKLIELYEKLLRRT